VATVKDLVAGVAQGLKDGARYKEKIKALHQAGTLKRATYDVYAKWLKALQSSVSSLNRRLYDDDNATKVVAKQLGVASDNLTMFLAKGAGQVGYVITDPSRLGLVQLALTWPLIVGAITVAAGGFFLAKSLTSAEENTFNTMKMIRSDLDGRIEANVRLGMSREEATKAAAAGTAAELQLVDELRRRGKDPSSFPWGKIMLAGGALAAFFLLPHIIRTFGATRRAAAELKQPQQNPRRKRYRR
jgi:hypothetical protein